MRRRAFLAVLVALLVSALAVVGLGIAGLIQVPGLPVTASGSAAPTPLASPRPPVAPEPPAGPVLLAALATSAAAADPAAPTTAGIGRLLAPLLHAKALGPGVGAEVMDLGTGDVLLSRGAGRARTPASTQKLLVGAAALSTLTPEARLSTTVVRAAGAPAALVLVGGGDTTLTGGPVARRGPAWASLSVLADRTASALQAQGVTGPLTVAVDDSLFAGPGRNPAWPATYLTGGVVAPVSALCVDGGRRRVGQNARVSDPALDAGRRFAALLRLRGLAVVAAPRRLAAPLAVPEQVAAVTSPPVRDLVERLLTTSDDDLAEALTRLVGSAAAGGAPATVADGTAAVVAAVQQLGVPVAHVSLLDGSGLARAAKVPPGTLVALMAAAASGSEPELRALLPGLPVAGFSGTLADRFATGPGSAARGIVRAKTGTLTGVSSLAGLVTSASGHLLAFAVLADQVPVAGTLQARTALDRVATALAGCGCR